MFDLLVWLVIYYLSFENYICHFNCNREMILIGGYKSCSSLCILDHNITFKLIRLFFRCWENTSPFYFSTTFPNFDCWYLENFAFKYLNVYFTGKYLEFFGVLMLVLLFPHYLKIGIMKNSFCRTTATCLPNIWFLLCQHFKLSLNLLSLLRGCWFGIQLY